MSALVSMALAALVSASVARNEPVPDNTPRQAPAARPEPLPSQADERSLPHPAPVADAEIEAVASAIARKYRVSHDVMRELVGTAYREGRGIGLDPLLIIAVMAVESRFNPIAQSDGGAIGLMQVIPRYHADKLDAARGVSMFDPGTNIRLGARVLKEYIRRGGTDVAGLQLYNGAAGDSSAAYANRVLGEWQRLRETARRSRDLGRA
jgi:soluble lytic murein transglycosylase-like protein